MVGDDVAPTSLYEGRGKVKNARGHSCVTREASSVNGWGGAVRWKEQAKP